MILKIGHLMNLFIDYIDATIYSDTFIKSSTECNSSMISIRCQWIILIFPQNFSSIVLLNGIDTEYAGQQSGGKHGVGLE